ncbi:sugar phosphate isomerase/epimerase [Candidatus Poribacteria bacterium]|nr:sugar phosphate isomerase/epimerase [Candidatus Poribacteria bacterium]
MPHLAVFPKGYMDDLCVHKTMTLLDWIELASELDVEGLEFYDGFFESFEPEYLDRVRKALDAKRLAMPMLCFSPDFTQPDPDARQREIERTQRGIELSARLGGVTCRVLSGQARPEVERADGVRWTVECIRALLPHAERHGIVLAMENHYKDGYWLYREFAQRMDVFLEIVDQIDSPWFRVNYDPSNALVAGDDPIELLHAVKTRVVSMHASDRYLSTGNLDDLKQADGTLGYVSTLKHGVIGEGLNDYDAIFSALAGVGFDGWVSIEDGENGMDDLRASVAFLREKMRKHFPASSA